MPPAHLPKSREEAHPSPPKQPGFLLSCRPGKERRLKLPQSWAELPLGGEGPADTGAAS